MARLSKCVPASVRLSTRIVDFGMTVEKISGGRWQGRVCRVTGPRCVNSDSVVSAENSG
jgi:hypothetical protein